MSWHYLACPDCPWSTTRPTPQVASVEWAEHFTNAHAGGDHD